MQITIRDDGSISDSTRVELSMDVWPHWLDVAMEHAATAIDLSAALRTAVEEAEAAGSALDAALKTELLRGEFKAGMVATSSAAFALDNFYAVASAFTPGFEALRTQWQQAGTARHSRISETLRRTFMLRPELARDLPPAVRDIFRLRDAAVHPPRRLQGAGHASSAQSWRRVAVRRLCRLQRISRSDHRHIHHPRLHQGSASTEHAKTYIVDDVSNE